jgi:hypothetical protein
MIIITRPVLALDQLQIPFTVENGSPSAFWLLQTSRLGSSWTTNASPIQASDMPGLSYKFTIPLPAANEYYQIQAQ